VVLCAQEDEASVDLDRTLPQDAASRGLRRGRSPRTDLSLLVGGHSPSLSGRTLLHGFLEGLSGRHSQREQHTAVGKETGETAHVERWNNTLRQRLARFVRKTLSFSKSALRHTACLTLFLHRYNRERAIMLM
jgi:hypothetical protein